MTIAHCYTNNMDTTSCHAGQHNNEYRHAGQVQRQGWLRTGKQLPQTVLRHQAFYLISIHQMALPERGNTHIQ